MDLEFPHMECFSDGGVAGARRASLSGVVAVGLCPD
jgi:hypothetical protein